MPGSGRVSKDAWINLTGPGVGPLTKAFFGPSVTVLQENMGPKGATTHAEDRVLQKTIVMAGKTSGAQKYIKVQKMYRIVLLGDTGAGKCSLANTIFGEDVFKVDNTECQAESKSVCGRRITLINTPDFSAPGGSEEDLKPEILKCITECTPGPHAFFIVLNVETSTEQQQAVIEKISQHFSEEAFKYAAVFFTQDDRVSNGMKIKEFVDQNKCLSDLVKKCKSRYHIINKYNQQGDGISNQSKVAELLNTVDQIVKENKGRSYTSKMLPQRDTCNKTNNSVSKNELIKLTGPAAESLAKAFSGPAVVVLTARTTNGEEEENEEEKSPGETMNKGHPGEIISKVDGETTKNTEEREKKEEVGGLESFVGVLFGFVVGLGGPLLKGGAAFIAAAIAAAAAELASAGGAAGTTGATGAGADRAGAGGAAGNVAKTLKTALAVGKAAWVRWVKQTDCELIVIVFFSLLLTWYFLKVPFFGTLLAILLFVLLFIILDMI